MLWVFNLPAHLRLNTVSLVLLVKVPSIRLHSYAHNGHRALKVGKLLHMDLCGPYPTLTPDGKQFFFAILDDHSNWGFTHLLCLKSEAFQVPSYHKTEAFLLCSFGTLIITVRLDGPLELCKGILGDHFAKQGIVVQQTAPYAHQQAVKIERYFHTIEEGGQTLLADSGLPMSFWGWAVLTSQYLRNRLPTSTLSANTTPFEVMMGKKPDLSHLRIWDCQCFPTIPLELCTKASPRCFEAIFIGYEEARIGWLVQDLKGAVHFSQDVIFNEDLSGRLGVPRSIISRPSSPILSPDPVSAHPVCDRMLTMAGRDYANALCLKQLQGLDRVKQKNMSVNGGASDVAVDGVAANGVMPVCCVLWRCYTWRSLVLCSAQHQKQKTRKTQRKVRAQLLGKCELLRVGYTSA